MKEENEPLDKETMSMWAAVLSLEITELICKKERSKEMHAGAIAALADILVLISCKMCGYKTAQEIVPMAIAHGFKIAAENPKLKELLEL